MKVTTEEGHTIQRKVELDVVTPEAIILGKEEYHIQQVNNFFRMIIEWINKETCLKPVFANSFSFPLF